MQNELIAPEDLGFGWRDLVLALLVFLCGGIAVVFLGRFVASLLILPPSTGLLSPVAYVSGVGLYLMLLLGIYLFGARRAGWAALGIRGTSWLNIALVPLLFIVGLSVMLAVTKLMTMLVGNFENPQVNAISGGKAMSLGELGAGLLLIAVLVPFVEELFFRGMLYPLLRQRAPAALAIVANAAIFAIVHMIPVLIPSLFVIGLCLAFLRERSGSIWPCVFYHAMQNGLAMLAIYVALNTGMIK